MSKRAGANGIRVRLAMALLATGLGLWLSHSAWAQQQNLFSTRAVGGVMIDPQGMLVTATAADLEQLRQALNQWLGPVPKGLDEAAPTRRISLRRIEQTVRQCAEAGQELPDGLLYLGGLLRIEYVLVYPEKNDVVLVGPAEPWHTNARGAVVGRNSGKPVMLLDDLVVALRSAFNPQPTVISCSIDPTPEGIQRFVAASRKMRGVSSTQAARILESQLGPQLISITGVPEESHFARVMVSADYRMKRIGMNLEPAPVPGLPSFLHLVRSGKAMNMLPRWWLAPDYQPLVRAADGLAWHIRGGSVKAMAESDFLGDQGVKRGAGRPDPVAQRWAELLTERYDELAQADPAFGQLRNCMDLAVVGALLAKEGLLRRAGLELPVLLGRQPGYATIQLPAPRQAPSKTAMLRKRGGWLVAAGGVQINPWQIVEQTERGGVSDQIRDYTALEQTTHWWAN